MNKIIFFIVTAVVVVAGIAALSSVFAQGNAVSCYYMRGDANSDGDIDLSDAVYTLNYLFLGRSAPGCLDAADVNDDGNIDLSDAVYTLNYLFLGRSVPKDPFSGVGIDPTEDGLSCGSVPREYESNPDDFCQKAISKKPECDEGSIGIDDGECRVGNMLAGAGEYSCGFGKVLQSAPCEYEGRVVRKIREGKENGLQQDVSLCLVSSGSGAFGCGTYEPRYRVSVPTKDETRAYNYDDTNPDVASFLGGSSSLGLGSVVVWERYGEDLGKNRESIVYMCGLEGLDEAWECEKKKVEIARGAYHPVIKYSLGLGLVVAYETDYSVEGCIVKSKKGVLSCDSGRGFVLDKADGTAVYPVLTGGEHDVLLFKTGDKENQRLMECILEERNGRLTCEPSSAGTGGYIVGTGDEAGGVVVYAIKGGGEDAIYLNDKRIRFSDVIGFEDSLAALTLYEAPGLFVGGKLDDTFYVVFKDVNMRSEIRQDGLAITGNTIWIAEIKAGNLENSGEEVVPDALYKVVSPYHMSSEGVPLRCNDLKTKCWAWWKELGPKDEEGRGNGQMDPWNNNLNKLGVCPFDWFFNKGIPRPSCLKGGGSA